MGIGEKILSLINKVNEYSFKLIEIPKNHYLLNHSELEENIYFVVDGAIKLVYIDENEEHTLRFGYKNSIITSLQSLLKREPSQCYIQSIRKQNYIVFL